MARRERGYPGSRVAEDIFLAQSYYGATDLEVYYDDLDYGTPSYAVQQAYADWANKVSVSDQTSLFPTGGTICPTQPGVY